MVTTNRIILAGEARGPESVIDYLGDKVRATIRNIGFEQEGFHWRLADYSCLLHLPSWGIAKGIDAASNLDEGAGGSTTVFGYATNETPELMPASQQYAQNVLRALAEARHSGELRELEPDGRCQVTLAYDDNRPVHVTSIAVVSQHRNGLSSGDVLDLVRPYILKVFPEKFITKETAWFINPEGSFSIGGPDGDCGLTGRKPQEDSYW